MAISPIRFDPADFPALEYEGFEGTSSATWDYNCIAWAAHDQDNWWWPLGRNNGKHSFWPQKAPNKVSVKAFAVAFETLGYRNCKNGDPELGFEKIALYAKDGRPEHAARQLPDGRWTHKMGSSIDLVTTLSAVEGPLYGTVVRYMRRAIT